MGYLWRQLNPKERESLLSWRMARQFPWHSPPHRVREGRFRFHISAACYEHEAIIGASPRRMDFFAGGLLDALAKGNGVVHAWCVLPNHYHALVETENLRGLLGELGRFHGRTAFEWNGQEMLRGRQVFCRAADRMIRSERHFWATMNYIHNNAVHHRYVKIWTEWPWSSAAAYLESVGRDEAEKVWRKYPVKGYGAKWDSADV